MDCSTRNIEYPGSTTLGRVQHSSSLTQLQRAYLLAGQNGKIIFVNEFVEEIYGYSPVDFFKNPDLWTEKIYDEDRERVIAFRKKSFEEGKEFVAEYRIRHRKGHMVYVIDHAIPFRSVGDTTTRVDGIIMDVTQRVKLQEKLLQVEGLKTIAEVSARLAHEIRNPLMSAGGFARRLLSSMSPSDPNRNKVEIIVHEVSRLESILRMILNYMHPLELNLSLVEANSWVEKAVSAVVENADRKGIGITTQLDPGLSKISIDYEQMVDSLITLLQNAIHQMEKRSNLSIITCREGGIFKLTIRYPVKNIPHDDIKAFFYPFTTSPMILDTVDLSIAKALINKHNGIIRADLKDSNEMIIEISLPF
jgi:PAS domain S-box-containing protein